MENTTDRFELLRSADQFLREHGFEKDGREKGSVKGAQVGFESRRIIKCPMGGARKPYGSRIIRGGNS